MITPPEAKPAPSGKSDTPASGFFEKVLNQARLAAGVPQPADGEKTLKPKVLASTHAAPKADTQKPADADSYKDITELPEKLDIDTLKVVAKDSEAGVIYFEHAGNKYQISEKAAQDAQPGFETFENLRFGHAVPTRDPVGPDHGTQLYNLLDSLAETQGTPAYDVIKDSLANPDQELLRKDDGQFLLENIDKVEQPADGVLKVTLTSGKEVIIAKGITPEAFEAYRGAGKTKEALADGKAQGYEQVTGLPGGLDVDKLKVVSEDKDTGVILFEHDGHKYMISRDDAAAHDRGYDALDSVPSAAANQPAPENRGSQLYSFLHALDSTQGTPAFDYIKNAHKLPDQHLQSRTEGTLGMGDISKIDSPTDGIVVVTQNDGKLVVVSKDIAPEAFLEYTAKGQTLAGIEKAKADGYSKAGPDDYLPSTEDIMSVGGVGDYGPGLIAFTQRKPGGEEQKIIVSQFDNPQMFDQISSYRTTIAEQITDVDKLRADHGLPPLKEVTVDELPTTEKDENGQPLSVRDLAVRDLVDEYRAGIKDGSIAKDDPRAKFVRALEAKSMSEHGMQIIPEHGFGNHGSATDPVTVTSRDVRDEIFDVKNIDAQIGELLGNETIVNDLKAKHDGALAKVEGGSAKVDETRQKLLDSTSSDAFVKYINDLQASGQTELATREIQSAYASLADIDPAKADEFLQNLQIDGYTMEVDKLIADPSKISDDNTALATTDQALLILQALKASGDGIPRRSLATYEKFVEMLVKDKDAATDFGKVMASLGDAWQKNGTITLDDINKALSTELMPHLSAENRGLFTRAVAFLSDNGVLGSMGGAISLGRAIYQLVGKGGSLADTPRERVGIANDFIGFLSTGSHFATLGTKVFDKAFGTNAYKLMGLDRSVPLIWSKPATAPDSVPRSLQDVHNQYYNIIDDAMADGKDVSKALNGQPFDEASMTKLHEGIESGIDKRGGVMGAGKVARFAGSAIKVIGAGADVVGGVISVVTGGLTIRDGVREKDPIKIASGSLSVAGGVSSLVGAAGSVAGVLGTTGRLVPLLGPVGFLFSGVFSIVGAILGDIKSAKLHKISLQNWDQIQDFKQDGLLKPKGDEAYVWLQTYLSDWGQRDAPGDRSIFDFRKEEWDARSSIRSDNRKDHPDYVGDGNNRRSEDYKYSLKPSEWVDDSGNIVWMVGDGYGGAYKPVENS
ncbi:hypothetical protein P0Y43_20550 [Pseudomonas entomophila]|uniref:hypothetical protein n=1 Tax=Pseudomonas entomophila TaxID=312306 RepID=UPI0023D88CD0|nr:hypothetical protein [Pseudomonas entomophila]MDF0733087.1 hypothetical protein [Pseudomonas entomophila]